MRSIVIFRFFSHLSLLFVYQCITFLPLIFRFSFYNDAMAKRLYREGGEPEKAELIGNKIEVPKGRAQNRW